MTTRIVTADAPRGRPLTIPVNDNRNRHGSGSIGGLAVTLAQLL